MDNYLSLARNYIKNIGDKFKSNDERFKTDMEAITRYGWRNAPQEVKDRQLKQGLSMAMAGTTAPVAGGVSSKALMLNKLKQFDQEDWNIIGKFAEWVEKTGGKARIPKNIDMKAINRFVDYLGISPTTTNKSLVNKFNTMRQFVDKSGYIPNPTFMQGFRKLTPR